MGLADNLSPALDDQFDGHEFVFSSIEDYTSVRNEQYRFTLDNPSGTPCELFDLEADHAEMTNLVDNQTCEEVIRNLTSVIREHHAR